MTLKLVPLIILIAAYAQAGNAEPSKLKCKRADEALPGPLVPNEETARAIFLAVERARFPEADPANFPDVVALDEGDHWAVFRFTQRPGVKGGGQLEMEIGKCTGIISQVHLAK